MIKHFKKNPLVTAVGDFTYDKNIGEGGNAKVLAFKKGNLQYAIKFLPQNRNGPLSRFRDEYFCAAQIPSHPNVSQAYHLDRTQIDGADYSLIVMKRYQTSLHELGSIAAENDSTKADRGWKLLRALHAGMKHLHEHSIIHRDIKPQNIFFDQKKDTFVIGDLGIAHFSDELYAREAATERAERLANFACCAPEQVNPETPAAPTMDVFALGQVLNWYVRGSFVRGGGRRAYLGSDKELKLLDKIIEKCIQDDPNHRFQSMGDLEDFEHRERIPARDAWSPIKDLDETFRASIPRIQEFYETSDQSTINRLLENFSKLCDPKEFWYVLSDGGDNVLQACSKLESGRWLLHKTYECHIEKLICYKHPSEWQSFFVLLVAADDPFEVTGPDGQITPRPNMENWHKDVATFYDGRYIETEDANNGYFLHNNEMVRVDFTKTQERHRFLRRDALLIVPAGAGAVCSNDRRPNETFLNNIVITGTTNDQKIRNFIGANLRFTNYEITKRL